MTYSHRAALLSLLLGLLISASPASAQYWTTSGTQILDPNGEASMQRGMGLGGWLMPEGYMLDMGGSWTEMQEKVADVVDPFTANEVWRRYRENYVNEKDIEKLVEWGFDHVRIPFHYEIFMDLQGNFIEEGFTTMDEFLGWCETYGLPVILDLHAAPGGQSGGAIDDSDGVARLWNEPDPYQDLTVLLWEELARRYKDRTIIIGYDLLNEPVTPNSIGDGAQALRDLYGRLRDAVRAIDTDHILFIEGNYFATTFDKLTPPFDDNMVYAFHKYWSAPSIGTINYLLAIRDEHNVPLWLGETGENSNPWFHEVVTLAESNGIPWNFWTHKQLEATAPPTSSPIKPGFRALLNYWNGNGSKPSAGPAQAALYEMVANLHIDSVEVRIGVLEALFNPDFGSMQVPVAANEIPGVINAVDYDLGTQGVAYNDANPWAVTGAPGGGNTGGVLRNDGVDIEVSTDTQGPGYNVGWLEPFEWIEYTVDVTETGVYDITARVASSPGGGSMVLSVDGTGLGTISVPATGGWQSWVDRTLTGVSLEAGERVLRMAVGRRGDFNLNTLTFTKGSGVGVEDQEVPKDLRLESLFPNPASRSFTVNYSLPAPGEVQVELFDLMGRRVWQTSTSRAAGEHAESVAVGSLAPGVYAVRLTHGGKSETRPLVVRR
ncbi:MAG: cellulase family glycosylhydrolase [Rhodothermales bacterium]|nr:cellulase family glycosylhydrolase [Rhodothermales bacterium]